VCVVEIAREEFAVEGASEQWLVREKGPGNFFLEISIGEVPAPIAYSTSKTVIYELVIMANEAHDERTLRLV